MNKRIALLALLAAAIAAYFWFDLGQYLSLDAFKAQQAQIIAAKDANPLLYIGGFFLIYVIVTALSLTGAAIMSLVADDAYRGHRHFGRAVCRSRTQRRDQEGARLALACTGRRQHRHKGLAEGSLVNRL